MKKARLRWILIGFLGLTLGVWGSWVPSSEASADEAEASVPEAKAQTSLLNRPLERANRFAPAGVILDHTHAQGDWTFLYQYERRSFDGLLSGSASISNAEVANTYPFVPLSHTEQVHTFGFMYAPRDRFTLAFMLPYVVKELEQINGLKGNIRESLTTDGIGDARLILMMPFIRRGEQQTQFNVELSFPTGSIRVKGADGIRLPYLMQRGTGTWDVHYGITYIGEKGIVSWGGQLGGQYRLSENSVGYRLGAQYQASGWLAGELFSWLSVSGRMEWIRTGNIHGEDPELVKSLSPLNNNMKQSGTLLQVGPGMNVLVPIFGGQRLAVEVLFPIYQDLDGPQLASGLTVTAGWQWLF
ncbi:MAG: hypothetical protein CL917_16845 [Deltaproteobacteria bacterium]|nr:hypothetical protein [Deltaproteobacteria bacterium]